jgi:hypothetical protein
LPPFDTEDELRDYKIELEDVVQHHLKRNSLLKDARSDETSISNNEFSSKKAYHTIGLEFKEHCKLANQA